MNVWDDQDYIAMPLFIENQSITIIILKITINVRTTVRKKLPNNIGFVVLSDQQNAGLNIIYSKEVDVNLKFTLEME